MKTIILLICLIVAGCVFPYESAHGAEISKADIIATVEHLRSLTHEAQAETAAAKAETATIQQAADKLKQERDDWKNDDAKAWAYGKGKAKEAHDNAKQRDVVIWAFALAFAGLILRAFPLPGWYIVAEGALSLACGYAMGRFALAWLASLMP